jgi:hypothetical protein
MTRVRGFAGRFKSTWSSGWPLYAVLALALLEIVHFLPAGYPRAIVAAPTLLLVPGSLALGAVFGERLRPRGAAFFGNAALLGAVWVILVSLGLYVVGIRITLTSTYLGLLIVSAALAAATEARIWLERTGEGRRVARVTPHISPDMSGVEVAAARSSVRSRARKPYAIAAMIWGACLLAGAVVTYEHLPRPAAAGYTYIAWADKDDFQNVVPVGPSGTDLNFQIVNREPNRDLYKLTADWLTSPPRQMAPPMYLTIPVGQTFDGTLSVPPLPNGCLYRIVVEITAAGRIDPATGKPQSWSIDADIDDPGKPTKLCR